MNKTLWMVCWSVVFTCFLPAADTRAEDALAEHVAQKAAKKALVYQGPGACEDGCYQAAWDMAVRAGLTPVYVGPNDLNSQSSEQDQKNLFNQVAVWIQPGGQSRVAIRAMSATLKKALQNYVHDGGGYVGFCAGAFSATQIIGTTRVNGLNILPGRTRLFNHHTSADVIPIRWEGQVHHIFWQGGPFLSELPIGKAEVMATYPNGQIASARSVYGRGRVYVTGLHPEAPEFWAKYYNKTDPDGVDHELVDRMIAWVIAWARVQILPELPVL